MDNSPPVSCSLICHFVETSSYHFINHMFLGTKFGAASPQAVRKMLALSDPHKTRPYQPKHCPPPLPVPGLALHSSGLEPSPGAPRRVGSGSRVPMHERSHSDTPTSLPPPVDLSAESSSVTSLSNLQPLRKTLTSGKYDIPSLQSGLKRDAVITTIRSLFYFFFNYLDGHCRNWLEPIIALYLHTLFSYLNIIQNIM